MVGGWSVRRWMHRGGAIGSEARGTRSHTGRIRPHQSILRVQGHRPTNYPGLIDARRRRKKPESTSARSTSGRAFCPAGPFFSPFRPRRFSREGENDHDRLDKFLKMIRVKKQQEKEKDSYHYFVIAVYFEFLNNCNLHCYVNQFFQY